MNNVDGTIPSYITLAPSLEGKRWMIRLGAIALIGAVGFIYAHLKLGTRASSLFGTLMGGGIIAIPITYGIDRVPTYEMLKRLRGHRKTDQPLLHTACSLGDVKAIQWLIGRGAKLDYNGHQWEPPTPLTLAVINNHLETVKLLIREYEVNINQKSCYEKQTALHRAVRDKKLEIARYLLEQGANPNLTDRGGKLPFFYAADSAMSKLLKCYGAKKEVPKESPSPNQTSLFDRGGQNL